MITEEKVCCIWRMYDDKTADEIALKPPFVGVCVVFYVTPTLIYVKGLLALMDRKRQREFLKFCIRNGIELIRAEREPGRTLPMGRRDEDGDITTTSTLELMKRFREQPQRKEHRRASDSVPWADTRPAVR